MQEKGQKCKKSDTHLYTKKQAVIACLSKFLLNFLISNVLFPYTDAIEYIYTGGAIPLESIEVVGRANAKDIAKRLPQNATETMWFKETMKDLFGNKF